VQSTGISCVSGVYLLIKLTYYALNTWLGVGEADIGGLTKEILPVIAPHFLGL
jgi:hypothetical protein